MSASKQLINLVGVLVTVLVLVGGIALIALPMYSQARTIDSNTRTVAQTNAVYEQQISQLTAVEADSAALDAELEVLREQIAASPQLDDVHKLVADAAKTLDIRVVSVSVADPVPWAARTAGGDTAQPAAPTEEGVVADPAVGSEEETSSVDDSGVRGAPAVQQAGAEQAGAEQVGAEQTGAEQEVTVTITVDLLLPYSVSPTDDDESGDAAQDPVSASDATALAAKASRFIDALGAGPRLIAPINVAYSDGKIVVDVLAYFHTEGS